MKFHIGPSGPGKCMAKPGKCPFAEESDHFASKIEATKEFERRSSEQFGETTSVSRTSDFDRLFDSVLEASDSNMEKARRKIRELEETIAPQVEAERVKIAETLRRKEKAVSEWIKGKTLDEILSPENFVKVSKLGWSEGRGSHSISKKLGDSFEAKNCYVGTTGNNWKKMSNGEVLFTPTISIPTPSDVNEDKLQRSAEVMGKIFTAVPEESLTDYSVPLKSTVYGYGDDKTSILKRDGKFLLVRDTSVGKNTLVSSRNLRDLLERATEKYYDSYIPRIKIR